MLLIEGKRTDTIATYTDWCSSRHQIARNLEAAQSIAKGKRYAVMVAAETVLDVRTAEIERGLPHMNPCERSFPRQPLHRMRDLETDLRRGAAFGGA